MTEGTYIRFVLFPSLAKKTQAWEVVSKGEEAGLGHPLILGTVKWFGAWRKYAFFPANDRVFEEVCLREIAAFCQSVTTEHREAKKRERETVDT